MYEVGSSAGLLEKDRSKERETLCRDDDAGSAGEEGRRGAQGDAQGVSRRLEFSARFLQSEHGPFHCLMAGIAMVLCLVLTVLFRLENISVINLHLGRFLLSCAVPVGGAAAYCHWAKHSRLRDGCLMVLWACIFFNLLQLPQYAAARTGLPLRDALFMCLDRAIGVDGSAVIAFIRRHPKLDAFSIRSYGLMPYLVFAAILIPALAGKPSRSKEFLLATTIASLAGSCVLAILPAIGPWAGYHFQPYWNQAWFVHELNALRSAAPFIANPDYTCGLITFPSFHVILAVLTVFALWPFRWIRLVASLIAALIAVSTVTTGWHYACDGIVGTLLALVSIIIRRKILGRRSSTVPLGKHRGEGAKWAPDGGITAYTRNKNVS